jgi:hypothetical protein
LSNLGMRELSNLSGNGGKLPQTACGGRSGGTVISQAIQRLALSNLPKIAAFVPKRFQKLSNQPTPTARPL